MCSFQNHCCCLKALAWMTNSNSKSLMTSFSDQEKNLLGHSAKIQWLWLTGFRGSWNKIRLLHFLRRHLRLMMTMRYSVSNFISLYPYSWSSCLCILLLDQSQQFRLLFSRIWLMCNTLRIQTCWDNRSEASSTLMLLIQNGQRNTFWSLNMMRNWLNSWRRRRTQFSTNKWK